MTPHIIANMIFWGLLISVGIFVYQAIILPGIRLHLRYRVFRLRDQLRRLVIEAKIEETDQAFHLVHERLNFMCSSLHRLDLFRVIQASSKLDEVSRERVANYVKVIESSPAELQKIFKESLEVVALSLTFNSLFFFILATACLFVVVSLKSGLQVVKEVSIDRIRGLFNVARKLFQEKVDADTAVAFFSPELATV